MRVAKRRKHPTLEGSHRLLSEFRRPIEKLEMLPTVTRLKPFRPKERPRPIDITPLISVLPPAGRQMALLLETPDCFQEIRVTTNDPATVNRVIDTFNSR